MKDVDMDQDSGGKQQPAGRWYEGVTGYQWLVLAIASAGWVFDIYEGQIFNITRNQMLTEILGEEGGGVLTYGDVFLGIFLLGGTVGGLAAGSLADRFGRRPIMMVTILMYSVFSGLTFFATELWHVAVLRFLVAMGVGGEWAVAASLVAEIFPARARAQASGIFHASSVLGTWMAALAGLAVGMHWRYAYLVGIVPALLILWVRASVREPERWEAEKKKGAKVQLGSFRDLLLNPRWRGRALLGMSLAAVGLGTFWAVTVAGQGLARDMLLRDGANVKTAEETSKFAYGIVQTAGGGLGLLAFGPLCAVFGRRWTFVGVQLLAFIIVPVTCFAPQNYDQLIWMLPVYGFFTLGMHAGYAIYFPELFPTHLRATGTSFCFNGGRVLAVLVLLFSGWLKGLQNTAVGWGGTFLGMRGDFYVHVEKMDLRVAVTGLSVLFLAGVVIVLFLPETKGQELPT
jgi:MFS family permease